MALFSSFRTWWGGAATANTVGQQVSSPSTPLVSNLTPVGEDAALQISALWACIELRSNVLASLPLFVYKENQGARALAKNERIYQLLHDTPNSRMTSFEFWRAIYLSLFLRGGAYVRLSKDDATGEVYAMWPMHYDQVSKIVLENKSIAYEYRLNGSVAYLDDSSVWHIKGLGNGTSGLDKLSFMSASLNEQRDAQRLASSLFKNGGRVSGVLMVDQVLSNEQRSQIKSKFDAIACEQNLSSLHVLEAGMKYQPLGLDAKDQQLIETRRFGVEEICSMMGVPPVLINRGGTTTWGTGIAEIKEGFYTLVLAPDCVNIQQGIHKYIMTPRQRAQGLSAEHSTDALLRANLEKRAQIYATMGQNGIYTRNFMRSLENLPPIDGGDDLTVQSNLLPINKLGQAVASGGNGDTIKQ